MGNTRRKFSSEFKSKVVLEALKERQTLSELASLFEVHPQQITNWKKEFMEKSAQIFELKSVGKSSVEEQEKEFLYAQIGQQKVEIEFLKKKWHQIQASNKGVK
ncbi:transposase IS3/IS911 family protein [Leadbetterella byssophila DSM 17132]|jgi:transposase|uniref:Transposase IS3/IS911 family protein n=1 Tax=Leadbetterella byssophila (strain DSM 17132 / JCM 16389 / KACC 11308 / NBRC 106382 / 4M15) TaxID=649349 RepID=E4RSV0_LEAB4|nr:transposase [Leadbetterella byssophila]ADQ16789.1 transposase IS3/IS911 family protein [Leadbetterella byssophila DSM 17132]ADQ17912.1 transposase IS3/IS911 family protein [Leadbetterella byssophila DSM 17132]